MTEKPTKVTKDKPTSIEVVERLPEIAIIDKIIYNKEDKCFYIGKDDKEVN